MFEPDTPSQNVCEPLWSVQTAAEISVDFSASRRRRDSPDDAVCLPVAKQQHSHCQRILGDV